MKKTILLYFLLLTCNVFAQSSNERLASLIHPQADAVRLDNQNQSLLFIQFHQNSFIAASGKTEILRSFLKTGPQDGFRLLRTDRDENGMAHHRYQQTLNGIDVLSGEYIIHEKEGRIVSANGKYHSGLSLSVAPVISQEVALKFALSYLNASKYMWESEVEENLLKQVQDNINATYFPKGELVILPALGFDKQQQPSLCWKYDVYCVEPLGRYNIYISATDGKIVFKENRICTGTVIGTGNTMYNGTRTFNTDSISPAVYRLRDGSRGGGVETYNLGNGTTYVNTDFTDSDNNWTSTTNQDHAALDAHWGAQKTYDYYLSVHNRNSYNNTGGILRSYVHYSSSYNNAFWDGLRMTYGDGDGSVFSPLTELDVVGHELTHGVTEYSSNLVYANESGALNESFSDIFGKTIDFFVNPATADWRIGGKCYTPSTSGDALRHMHNPNLAGDPDTYLGSNWYSGTADNGGVHTNSGVQNFWYYLLVTGGSGTNDLGFNYNVAGIGITKARAIAYRNNTFYLTSSSGYADAAFYSLQSATDLYGNCSPEAQSVKNAWDAVGVYGLQLNANAVVSVSGGSCVGNAIQLNASGGISFQWSGPNGFSSTQQNPVINNAALINAGTYTCLVTDANGCTGNPSVQVVLSLPPSLNAGTDVTICKNASANLNALASVNGSGGNTGFNSTPLSLPDAPAPAVSSTINISGSTNANGILSVTIDSLTHTWDGDLDIRLVAPNGSEIVLSSSNGGSGDNFIKTNFTPGAVTSIINGVAPFTGTWQPENSFVNLTGPANGGWKIKIQDVAGQDVGTLWKWSIELPSNVIASYSWSPSSGLSNAAINNPVATPASSTNYAVTVTDAQGCTATDIVSVSVSDPLLTAVITPASCASFNGAIDLSVANGIPAYIYNWSGGATTQDLSALAAGVYTVTVTDAANCVSSGSFTVPSSGGGAPTPGTINGASSACANQSNVNYNVASVAGAITYNWTLPSGATGSSTTNSINVNFGGGFTGGNICVSVTNECGTGLQSCKPITAGGGTIPARPGTINGQTQACANTTKTFSVAAVANASIYNWVAPANATIISGQGTTTVQVSFNASWVAGVLSVTAGNCAGNSAARTISLRGIPGTPGTITGNTTGVCPGSTKAYSITAIASATGYLWTAPAGSSISGQGTNSVQITFPVPFATGAVSVVAQNACGNSAARTITVRSTPATPGTITGSLNNNCNKTNVAYSVAPSTTGATGYTWIVPAFASIAAGQNTNSILVNFNGSGTGAVSVTANNACGSSTARTLNNITTLAARPAAVVGPNTVCINQTNINYSCASQAGVVYNWTVPAGASIVNGQGTSSISVSWGTTAGSVSVVANNACGNAQSRSLAVTINCRASEEAEGTISLAPNPATDETVLTLSKSNEEEVYLITVYDVLGNIMMRKSTIEAMIAVSTKTFSKGIYFIRVESNESQKTLRLVVK